MAPCLNHRAVQGAAWPIHDVYDANCVRTSDEVPKEVRRRCDNPDRAPCLA